MSKWANEYRRLSVEASSEPGVWRTARAPYQQGIMDAVNDVATHTVVMMTSAQVGKTEIINNIIGYFIAQDPCPMLLLQPTLEMAEAWSKDRFAPMLRDTPVLRNKVKDPRTRDSSNTLLRKQFAGGHITMAGANSPASLASRPVRIVLCDEVDRYPLSAGSEGDPVNLAIKRTTTFFNRKCILVSTPTLKGASRIETAYSHSDQRRYLVPCPHCKQEQILQWVNVKWEKENPKNAHYECTHCHVPIAHHHKAWMLQQGQWQASNEFQGTAGFHLSELYSPWVTWGQMAEHFLAAKGELETLKTWVNTALGETWEVAGERVAHEQLLTRRIAYGPKLPEGALVLTAGIDVQDDRIELQIDAWGEGFEKWVIDYQILYGSPAQASVWQQLDKHLQQEFKTEQGVPLKIASAFIDSGGHFTTEVYRYTKTRQFRRIFAIKGRSTAAEPVVGFPHKLKSGVILYLIGTDTAKELLYSRLHIQQPGPGYCHFHNRLPEEYFKQLTAEQRVLRQNKWVWVLQTGRRNEVLDCSVYSLACVEALRPNFAALKKRLQQESENLMNDESLDENTPHEEFIPRNARSKQQNQNGSFINAWRY